MIVKVIIIVLKVMIIIMIIIIIITIIIITLADLGYQKKNVLLVKKF